MAGPVAVEVAPAPPQPRLAVLLEACRVTAPSGTCAPSAEAAAPSAVAIVSWNADETEARLRVGVRRRGEAHWAERTLRFSPEDPALERWRSVGLAVGTLAGEADETAERAAAAGTPAPTPDPPRSRAAPTPEAPPGRPAPAPVAPPPAPGEPWVPALALGLSARIPGEGGLAPGFWCGAEAARGAFAGRLELGYSARSGPAGVEQGWWTAGLAAEASPWAPGFGRLGLRVSRWTAELTRAGATASAAAWMPGVSLALGARWPAAGPLRLEGGLGGVVWLREGQLRDRAGPIGQHPQAEAELTLGVTWAP